VAVEAHEQRLLIEQRGAARERMGFEPRLERLLHDQRDGDLALAAPPCHARTADSAARLTAGAEDRCSSNQFVADSGGLLARTGRSRSSEQSGHFHCGLGARTGCRLPLQLADASGIAQ
jgi:hypothetical protein